jgi:type IV pilus assembly protein PilP
MRALGRFLGNTTVLAASLLLVACSGDAEMIALQNYVNEAVNRPPSAIEPLPEFVSYQAFTYSASSLRSPFDVPVDISELLNNQRSAEVRPDENRPREALENFALGALAMVGTLSRDGRTWALIRDEANNVTRITVGNYLGRNHGRIVNVTETQVELVEIVPTGDDGWIERPQTIVMGQ